MWFEILPSVAAMGACLSLLEISPFVFNYLSWGCPTQRHSVGQNSTRLLRRDQRIAQNNGVIWFAKHQYTYGLEAVDNELQLKGNYSHYAEAEKIFLAQNDK